MANGRFGSKQRKTLMESGLRAWKVGQLSFVQRHSSYVVVPNSPFTTQLTRCLTKRGSSWNNTATTINCGPHQGEPLAVVYSTYQLSIHNFGSRLFRNNHAFYQLRVTSPSLGATLIQPGVCITLR
jgi:hypothetical protein